MTWHIQTVIASNPSMFQRWIELRLITTRGADTMIIGFLADSSDALVQSHAWARERMLKRDVLLLSDIYSEFIYRYPLGKGMREVDSLADARRHPYRELRVK